MASRTSTPTFANSYFDSGYFYMLDLKLDSFEKYLAFNQAKFKEELEKIQTEYQAKNKNETNEDYAEHLLQNFIEDYSLIESQFDEILMSSILIQLFSFFETELLEVFYSWADFKHTSFSYNNLKGKNDNVKFSKHLKKELNVDVKELNPEWEFIKNVRELRNKIVHKNGIITADEKQKIEEMSFFDETEIRLVKRHADYKIIIMDSQFLLKISTNICGLLDKLRDEIAKKHG